MELEVKILDRNNAKHIESSRQNSTTWTSANEAELAI